MLLVGGAVEDRLPSARPRGAERHGPTQPARGDRGPAAGQPVRGCRGIVQACAAGAGGFRPVAAACQPGIPAGGRFRRHAGMRQARRGGGAGTPGDEAASRRSGALLRRDGCRTRRACCARAPVGIRPRHDATHRRAVPALRGPRGRQSVLPAFGSTSAGRCSLRLQPRVILCRARRDRRGRVALRSRHSARPAGLRRVPQPRDLADLERTGQSHRGDDGAGAAPA